MRTFRQRQVHFFRVNPSTPRLQVPSDLYLWEFAFRGGWTLLTKDADFFEQLALSGAPPKVIWVRTGNLRRIELEKRLLVLWPKIIAMAESHDLVEIHTDKIEGISFGPS